MAERRSARRVWREWPRSMRVRVISFVAAVAAFGVHFAATGIARYIAFGLGLGFILCVALPGIPGGLLELLGVRQGRVHDRSGWATAQWIFEYASVGMVGVLVCVYSVFSVSNQGSTNAPVIGGFSAIVTAFALGALMITAANNSRIGDTTREKVLAAAQKLIISGIMLGLFVVFFWVFDSIFKSLGGIDPNTLDFSPDGWRRGVSFWLTELSLVLGGLLFAAGIVEVVFALREIRVARRGAFSRPPSWRRTRRRP